MEGADLPMLPVQHDSTTHAGRVRLNAPKYVRSVIDDAHALPGVTSFDELQIRQTTMHGGKDAVSYLLGTPEQQWIIKLSLHGLEAEAEALGEWAKAGVHVPRIISHGVVPVTSRITPSVKYLVEEAVADGFGRLPETCDDYLAHTPTDARKIGRLMGSELAKMHTASSTRSFGDYSDAIIKTPPYKTWNNYLFGVLRAQEKRLRQLGIGKKELQDIREFIKQCQFVKQGRYLHGDFSIRNTAIQPYRNRTVIFDPSPLIGDPSWDVAVLYNNYEFRKRRLEFDDSAKDLLNRDLQLLVGFRQSYFADIAEENLLTAQLLQALHQAEYQEARTIRGGNGIDLRVRQEFIREIVDTMSRKVQNK